MWRAMIFFFIFSGLNQAKYVWISNNVLKDTSDSFKSNFIYQTQCIKARQDSEYANVFAFDPDM